MPSGHLLVATTWLLFSSLFLFFPSLFLSSVPSPPSSHRLPSFVFFVHCSAVTWWCLKIMNVDWFIGGVIKLQLNDIKLQLERVEIISLCYQTKLDSSHHIFNSYSSFSCPVDLKSIMAQCPGYCGLKSFNTNHRGFTCDLCGKTMGLYHQMWGCRYVRRFSHTLYLTVYVLYTLLIQMSVVLILCIDTCTIRSCNYDLCSSCYSAKNVKKGSSSKMASLFEKSYGDPEDPDVCPM